MTTNFMTLRTLLMQVLQEGADLDSNIMVRNPEYTLSEEGSEVEDVDATPEFIPVRTLTINDDQDEIQLITDA